MPKWVMTSKKYGGELFFYIGKVKVANIAMHKTETGFGGTLRFMDNEPEVKNYPTVSEAMKAMHEALSTPEIEDTSGTEHT